MVNVSIEYIANEPWLCMNLYLWMNSTILATLKVLLERTPVRQEIQYGV